MRASSVTLSALLLCSATVASAAPTLPAAPPKAEPSAPAPAKAEPAASDPESAAPIAPANAAPGTIRKEFAESIEANSVHGSDAPETAANEIKFFFRDLDIVG